MVLQADKITDGLLKCKPEKKESAIMKKTFVVVTENRGGHNEYFCRGHFGDYAHVIASSKDFILGVSMVEERHDFWPGQLNRHKDYVKVAITIDENLMVDGDYILVHHRRSPNSNIPGDSKRESYQLLAGNMPQWAAFPSSGANGLRKMQSKQNYFSKTMEKGMG